MPKNQPAPITTEQAIARARIILESGQKLTRAADAVSEARLSSDRAAAEQVKDGRLLNYRINTVPDALTPILEALMLAASNGAATPKELQHAVR
jgi:UDP-N-acetylmuramyl pentapeptide synthase